MWKKWQEETGNAIIEFIVIGVAVLMPMTYIVVAVGQVHAASMASEHAVREAARAFMTAEMPEVAHHRARIAAELALLDHGVTMPADAIRIRCSGMCLQPETEVQINLDWQMPLPWLPEVFVASPSIGISAVQRLPIDVYRGEP